MGRLARIDERDAGRVGGRYRLIEKLGTGGMSVVWRGYDEILGRDVAVKVLSAQLADDQGFRERLRQEALAAAGLCHPHITGIFDYGESTYGDGEDGVTVPYVVMELNDGESVAARLTRRGPLPWREAVTVAAEVASALATAHTRGVVHRDVTPANVMLTGSGAKVVDFGISALIGQRDAAPDGSLLGTPAYLAPERLAGGHVSPATDVYALGLLLYRSLTGRLPWPAENTTEALRAHLYADPEPIPAQAGMPAAVAELCLRCLAKAPADRPDATALAVALSEVVGVPAIIPPLPDVEGAPAPRPSLAARRLADRWGRAMRAGHRRVHAAAATVTLLAVIGVGWASNQQGRDAGSAQAAAPGSAAAAAQQPTRCRVRYQVRRDTGVTFDVSLAVTVVGGQALDAWSLEFAFPGNQRLTSLTDPAAQLAQDGRRVSVRPAGRVELLPGRALEVFLHGTYEQVNPLPTEFTLDGRGCRVMVLGSAVTPPAEVETESVQAAADDVAEVQEAAAGSSGGSAASSRTPRTTTNAKGATGPKARDARPGQGDGTGDRAKPSAAGGDVAKKAEATPEPKKDAKRSDRADDRPGGSKKPRRGADGFSATRTAGGTMLSV
jgi:serine/threonine-protein kinase